MLKYDIQTVVNAAIDAKRHDLSGNPQAGNDVRDAAERIVRYWQAIDKAIAADLEKMYDIAYRLTKSVA